LPAKLFHPNSQVNRSVVRRISHIDEAQLA
jgi:hypothetical protein